MTGKDLAIATLLSAGAAVELLSCLGVWLMRGTYNRLHYTGPASSLGPALLGAAVILHTPETDIICRIIVIVLILTAGGPVLAHAIARAQYAEKGGHLHEQPQDKEQREEEAS
jgi:monovalent cation/proton antiporter MnhG/PhaG subunit